MTTKPELEWVTPPPCPEDEQGCHFWTQDGPDFALCDNCGLDANILVAKWDIE